MRLDLLQQKELHKTLAKLSDRWEDKSLSEEIRDFALSEGPHHQMMAGEINQAIESLTNYAAANLRLKQNDCESWINDIKTAYQVSHRGEQINKPSSISAWNDFVSSNTHFFRRGDDIWPAYKILLQLAYEHGDNSPVTSAAEKWLSKGNCDWIWFYDTCRPKSYSSQSFRVVYEGHSTDSPTIHDIGDEQFLSWNQDEIILWEKLTGRLIAKMEGKRWSNWKSGIEGVTVDINNKRIFAWQGDQISPYLWNLDDGSLVQQLSSNEQESTQGGFFLGNQLITWSCDNYNSPKASLYLWDAESGNLIDQFEASFPSTLTDTDSLQAISSERFISKGSFWPDEKKFEQAVLWGLVSNRIAELAALHACVPKDEQSDWQCFRVLSNHDILGRHNKGLFIFDSHSGQVKYFLNLKGILTADLLDNGKFLLHTARSLRVWSPELPKKNALLTIHKGQINNLKNVLICDSGHVWIHANDGLLWHTHLISNFPPQSFDISEDWFFHKRCISETGFEYVNAVSIQNILCLDASTGNIIYSNEFDSSLEGVDLFINDWESLTCHKNGNILIWNPDPPVPKIIGKHNQTIKKAFLISETIVVSYTIEGEVKIWRKQLGDWDENPLAIYKVPYSILESDTSHHFLPNGDLIAIIGNGYQLVRWTSTASKVPLLLFSGTGSLNFQMVENDKGIFVTSNSGELAWIHLDAIDACSSLSAVNEPILTKCKLMTPNKVIGLSPETDSIGIRNIAHDQSSDWFENPYPEKKFDDFWLLPVDRVLGFAYSGNIAIWDMLTKSLCLSYQGHTQNGILPLSDGRVLVASDHQISILNPESTQNIQQLGEFPRPENSKTEGRFTVQGKLASPDGNKVIIWGKAEGLDDSTYDWFGLLSVNIEKNSGGEIINFRTQGYPTDAKYIENDCVLTLSQRKRPGVRLIDFELWDLNSGKRKSHYHFNATSLVEMFATNNGNVFFWANDPNSPCFEWWSPSNNIQLVLKGHTDKIKGVKPLGENLVMSWSEREVIIWDSQDGKLVSGPKEFGLLIKDIKVTPDAFIDSSFSRFEIPGTFVITAFSENDAASWTYLSDDNKWIDSEPTYIDEMVDFRRVPTLLEYVHLSALVPENTLINKYLAMKIDDQKKGITGFVAVANMVDSRGEEYKTAGNTGFASHVEWLGNIQEVIDISSKELTVSTSEKITKLRIYNDHLLIPVIGTD